MLIAARASCSTSDHLESLIRVRARFVKNVASLGFFAILFGVSYVGSILVVGQRWMLDSSVRLGVVVFGAGVVALFVELVALCF